MTHEGSIEIWYCSNVTLHTWVQNPCQYYLGHTDKFKECARHVILLAIHEHTYVLYS